MGDPLMEWHAAFCQSTREVKEAMVHSHGFGTDLTPQISLVCSGEDMSCLGIIGHEQWRVIETAPRLTRWAAIIRQATALTGADIAMHVMEYFYHDQNGRHEVIEVAAIDTRVCVWATLPYTYQAGVGVVWGDPLPPLSSQPFASVEMLAARQAWRESVPASTHSLKWLTDETNTIWTGHLAMLERMKLTDCAPSG